MVLTGSSAASRAAAARLAESQARYEAAAAAAADASAAASARREAAAEAQRASSAARAGVRRAPARQRPSSSPPMRRIAHGSPRDLEPPSAASLAAEVVAGATRTAVGRVARSAGRSLSHAAAHAALAVHGCSEVREGASAMEMDAARKIGAIMEMQRAASRSFLEKEAEAPATPNHARHSGWGVRGPRPQSAGWPHGSRPATASERNRYRGQRRVAPASDPSWPRIASHQRNVVISTSAALGRQWSGPPPGRPASALGGKPRGGSALLNGSAGSVPLTGGHAYSSPYATKGALALLLGMPGGRRALGRAAPPSQPHRPVDRAALVGALDVSHSRPGSARPSPARHVATPLSQSRAPGWTIPRDGAHDSGALRAPAARDEAVAVDEVLQCAHAILRPRTASSGPGNRPTSAARRRGGGAAQHTATPAAPECERAGSSYTTATHRSEQYIRYAAP